MNVSSCNQNLINTGNSNSISELHGVLKQFLQDIDSNPEEALPQSFSFVAFLQSQQIPKVPQPPPNLEPFDINISEQIQRVSDQYRKSTQKENLKTSRDRELEKSSSEIIQSLPSILKNRYNNAATTTSDATIGSIAERILYPNDTNRHNPFSVPSSSVVNINQ